jgi:hypothetical protein
MYFNRESVPKMESVKGTQQLHAVASCQGERDSSNEKLRKKLRISVKPCSCLKCRGKAPGMCEFAEYRKEKVIWVEEECDENRGNQTKQARHPTIQLTREVEELLKVKMGVQKVTTETLRTYLKAKGQKIAGLKSELVTRVLALQQGCDDPVPLALTCTTVVDEYM